MKTLAIALLTTAVAPAICQNTTNFVNYFPSAKIRNLDIIPLTVGHWDCVVSVDSKSSVGMIGAIQVSLSTTANSLSNGIPGTATSGPNGGIGYGMSVSTPPIRVEVAKPTNYYLNTIVYYANPNTKVQVKSDYHCTSE